MEKGINWYRITTVFLLGIILLLGVNYYLDLQLEDSYSENSYQNGDYESYDSKDSEYAQKIPTATYRNIPKHFEWEYGFSTWYYDISIPSQNYNFYLNEPRGPTASTYYLTYEDPVIISIANKLTEVAEEKEYSKSEFVAAFIQSLHYVPDERVGYDEYPKFPIETLVEATGDCEDMAYLTASILLAMNIDTVLVLFEDHMGVGVRCGNCDGSYYDYDGQEYFYLETTASGYGLGDMPKEYEEEKARIIRLY